MYRDTTPTSRRYCNIGTDLPGDQKAWDLVVCMLSDVRLKVPQIDLPEAIEQQHRSITMMMTSGDVSTVEIFKYADR
jgi:hypothetical protein